MKNSIVTILIGLTFGSYALAQTIGESPTSPNLQEVATEIQSMKSSMSGEVAARTEKYTKDLKTLEKAIQSKGNLEFVLQIRTELKAWETGTPTTAPDPKDESITLPLRKLRYYFDRDVEEIGAKHQKSLPEKSAIIAKKLEILKEELTKAGKIDEALEARQMEEDLQAFVSKSIAKPGAVAANSAEMNLAKVDEGKKDEEENKMSLVGKSVYFTHPNGQNEIWVEFEEDGALVFVGLGQVTIEGWKYAETTPLKFEFWDARDGRQKPQNGFVLELEPDGKSGTAFQYGNNLGEAKVKRTKNRRR